MKSIIQTNEGCYYCGHPYTEVHHVRLGNCSRKRAETYGLVVNVCRSCHMKIHKNGSRKLALQMEGQRAIENMIGHQAHMDLFGKDYWEVSNVRTD